MSFALRQFIGCLLFFLAGPLSNAELAGTPTQEINVATTVALPTGTTNALPPLPEGVTHLKSDEFFRRPVGPRGLELCANLKALDGHRVRILGYMVRQGQPSPWKLLLAPSPLTTHEREYGLAEDLPPQLVHVTTDRSTPPIVPFTPGPLLLTGTLSVGNRDEADGRVSLVRLQLDPPSPEARRALTAGQQPRARTGPQLSPSANPRIGATP